MYSRHQRLAFDGKVIRFQKFESKLGYLMKPSANPHQISMKAGLSFYPQFHSPQAYMIRSRSFQCIDYAKEEETYLRVIRKGAKA